jgi:hypothetical protein
LGGIEQQHKREPRQTADRMLGLVRAIMTERSQVKTPGMPVFAGVGKHAFDIPVVLRGSSLISVLGENSLSFALYASIVDRFSAAPGARSSPPSR